MRARLGNRFRWLFVLLIILILVMPVLPGHAILIPLLIIIGIYSIVAIGLSLLLGYAGQICLGQAIFFGIGAYTSAILTTRSEVSPWLAIVIGILLAGVTAYVVGKPILRLGGFYLPAVTIALNTAFYILLNEMVFLTGGPNGIVSIPRLSIGNFIIREDIHWYYMTWMLVALALVFGLNLIRSRTGRALRSMDLHSGNEEAARMVGVNVDGYKIRVFILSAVYASSAGSMYVHHLSCVNPDVFNVMTSFWLVIMVIIGGVNSLWGSIAGTAIIWALRQFLSYILPVILGGGTGMYETVVFSIVFLLVIMLKSSGLMGPPSTVSHLLKKATFIEKDR